MLIQSGLHKKLIIVWNSYGELECKFPTPDRVFQMFQYIIYMPLIEEWPQ